MKPMSRSTYIVSPPISAPDGYIISKLLGTGLIRGRGINHIEFQSFVIVFFKIGMKYKTLLSISQENMKILRYQLYFHSSTVCIVAPNTFGFAATRMS